MKNGKNAKETHDNFYWQLHKKLNDFYCLVSVCVYYTCIIQLLNVGVGCPKYDEEIAKLYLSDEVKKILQENMVSHISSLRYIRTSILTLCA